MLKAGEKSEVNATLLSRYTTLIIATTPTGADLFLNRTRVGKTPFIIDTIIPGNYALMLKAKGYKSFYQNLSLVKNRRDSLSVNLYAISRQITRVVIYGLITGAFGGGGAYLNNMAAQEDKNAQSALTNYQRPGLSQQSYDTYWNTYQEGTTKTKRYMMIRNGLYGATGFFGTIFFFSIFF
jgi:hypothetical protein